MATYALGDIQGCYPSLRALLKKINFNERKDTLWCAGDLVNRGPESLETLRFIKHLDDRAKVVLGNHDLHLLAKGFTHLIGEGEDNLDDVLQAPDGFDLLHWLRRQPLLHQENGFIMVHAGINPLWSISQAKRCAQEVQQTLQGLQFKEYLNNMYGNQPDTWQGSLQGFDRLRCITNYFTRMRYCYKDGRLNFGDKLAPTQYSNEAFKPWFTHPSLNLEGQKLLFGHWAALQGNCPVDGIFALDTGCVWGAGLTALCLDTGERFYQEAVEWKPI